MAEHPRYCSAIGKVVLIGDTAHSAVTGQTGTVVNIRGDDVTIQTDAGGSAVVGIKHLRYGPAPEPEPPLLAIRPTWKELRSFVRMVDRCRDVSIAPPFAASVVDAIPADIAARLRAEIEAERQRARAWGYDRLPEGE